MAGGTHVVSLAPKIIFAHFDISGDSNAHVINQTVDLPDDTNYGDTFEQCLIGKRGMNFSIAGNMDLTDDLQDEAMQARIAVANVPLIITSNTAAVGDPCEFGRIALGNYNSQLSFGQVLKFGASGKIADRKWVLGKVLCDPATTISGTGAGAEVLIGAVSATQKLYVGIAVLTYTGAGSLTVTVESDTTGFPSTTIQKTFTNPTAITSEMPTPVDGAITDTYYRYNVTAFSATTVQMIVVAGIQ